jgi:hypothetical protein
MAKKKPDAKKSKAAKKKAPEKKNKAPKKPKKIAPPARSEDVDVLFTKLGAALKDVETGEKHAALYAMDGTLDGLLGPRGDEAQVKALWGLSWEGLKKLGQEFWNKVSRPLHQVFCDPKSEEHKQLGNLLKEGSAGIAAALAGLVTQALIGMVPAIGASVVALFVARLIIRLFVTKGYELACDKWAASLPPA